VKRGQIIIRWAIATAALAAAAGLGYWAASSPRTPLHRAAVADPPPATELYVPAQSGPLKDTWAATVVVRRRHSAGVTLQAPADAQRAVVSALPSEVDDHRLHPGALVVEVSGRPVIALPGAVPAYRDLGLGDRGTDVRQLRAALCTIGALRIGCQEVPDDFDAVTARAVETLYRQLGYAPPRAARSARLPAAEVVYVPRFPAVIDRARLRVGMAVAEVEVSIGWGSWRVSYVGASAPPPGHWSGRLENCAARGMEIRDGRLISFRRSGQEFIRATCDVDLTTSSGSADDWVIPLATVWTDSAGRSVVTARYSDGTSHTVAVEFLAESHGRALVQASANLQDSELRVMIR
jgi:hypothetical protein